ncbi:hypothetical protein MVEN_02319500 [Mycena venus]|uniref:Uncharacterized protein n=1 Tax=Mycena venus TaxID=2733690 RepID=A0A8H7CF48_9AGAR|nr:hypothetical protein MVEN_02319500 [Mycena venus]
MFDAAADIPKGEIKDYRSFAFPFALADPTYDPFSLWKMRLVGLHHGVPSYISSMFPSLFGILIKPRRPKFGHIALVSRASSRAASSVSSRAPSRAHSPLSLMDSRPSSRASFIPSCCAPSSRSSSPFDREVIVIDDSDDENDFPATLQAPPVVPKREESSTSLLPIPLKVPSFNTGVKGRKGKQKAASGIELTREETVDKIVEVSTIPSIWPVSRVPTAYLVDLSEAHECLKFLDKESPLHHKTIALLRHPHNHPAHPKTKPSANDRHTLGKAVQAAGVVGLTVQKLLNASLVYDDERVAASSPAFMDSRKVRDFIVEQKKKDHLYGMGWEGVLYHVNTKEVSLLKTDRYIHTAMSKNGFRLVGTMHPQISMFIHYILSMHVDYTFKHVDGNMDEWEVAGMSDRFKQRITFASLFCDAKTQEAFTQVFTELFDTITQVTGERLKLAPFSLEAKCHIIMVEGEVPQAQGWGHFLMTYNDPEVSGIHSRNPLELLSYCLKTCGLHFERHIDELSRDIPKTAILRLKSIMGLTTQPEIDDWHDFCASQEHADIKNWYAHKCANPWILPSVNKFLSKIPNDNWDITPNHSNIVETAHTGHNAETSIGVGLLTAILESQKRDNAKAANLLQIEHDGFM